MDISYRKLRINTTIAEFHGNLASLRFTLGQLLAFSAIKNIYRLPNTPNEHLASGNIRISRTFMKNINLVRGLFLMAISLAFGLTSMTYSIGKLGKAGPGMFPLIVSGMLFAVGLVTVIRSFFAAPVAFNYNLKNIILVMVGLGGFAVISHHLNMVAAIIFLVFCTAYAAPSFTVIRNIKISACLIAIAFAFKYLLGLNLPLI